MSINFSLSRERMLKEVEQCVALNRLDNLMSFCNSCSLDYECRPIPECRKCRVWQAIRRVSVRKVAEAAKIALLNHGDGSGPEGQQWKVAAG